MIVEQSRCTEISEETDASVCQPDCGDGEGVAEEVQKLLDRAPHIAGQGVAIADDGCGLRLCGDIEAGFGNYMLGWKDLG